MSGRWMCLPRRLFITQLLLAACFFAAPSFAAIDTYEFDSDTERKRYQSFIDELRCPKCQNQNLSGSDSPIAADLRRELHTMIEDGRSDKEIVDFMVDRYGDFILYRPRLTSATVLLWLGPALLFILGIIILIYIVVQRRKAGLSVAETASLNSNEQARLRQLLSEQNAAVPPQITTQTTNDKQEERS